MHGLIFMELKKYVTAKFDLATWEKLQEKAGQKHQLYLASTVYPDHDILALVGVACEMTGLPANAILEDFGAFIAPDLVQQYKFLVNPEWKLLDFLANTEDTIHKVIRFNKGVTPPRLAVARVAENRATITYNSGRKMCALLKGIIKGAAKHFKEEITISESRCMLHGDSECVVTVQTQAAGVHAGAPLAQKAAVR
jgi:predicted hydrocarbon binding protein